MTFPTQKPSNFLRFSLIKKTIRGNPQKPKIFIDFYRASVLHASPTKDFVISSWQHVFSWAGHAPKNTCSGVRYFAEVYDVCTHARNVTKNVETYYFDKRRHETYGWLYKLRGKQPWQLLQHPRHRLEACQRVRQCSLRNAIGITARSRLAALPDSHPTALLLIALFLQVKFK